MSMTIAEREEFLAGVHVAVLSVCDGVRGTLSVPIWYAYVPGGTVDVITVGRSRKGQLISRAGRFSLCAQTEVAPYKYVSVEGPVVWTQHPVDPDERRAVARRYLGKELGDLHVKSTAAAAAGNVMFRMAPESWLARDFSKQFR
jgi:nitroimidazol reductase NimA-like FMN-containing flavoprotein (pyridoxamine 5'-phosphate oxidase superfamily)